MFCKNCGAKISKLDNKCPNCGYDEKKDATNEKLNDDQILITKDETKKLGYIQLSFYVIILLLGVVLFFLPVFRFNLKSLEDFNNLDIQDMEQMFGKKSVSFSYYDETVRLFKNITAENSQINIHQIFSSLYGLILGLLIIIFSIIYGVYGLIKSLRCINMTDKYRIQYFLRFNKYPKDPILETPSYFFVVAPFLFSFFDGFFAFCSDISSRNMMRQNFFDFSNFATLYVAVPVLLLGFFALKVYASKHEQNLKKEIIKRRKEKKDSNKKKNEEAHQRKKDNKKEDAENNSTNKEKTIDVTQSANSSISSQEFIVSNHNTEQSFDELKKYKDLLDAGIITQEEFDAKKKQLLGL